MVDGGEYLEALRAIRDLPFGMGQTSLAAVLKGDRTHETVKRNRLDRERCFGCLSGYAEDELRELLRWLRVNGMIEHARPRGTFYRVIQLTQKGAHEIEHPTLNERKDVAIEATPLTEGYRKFFAAFDFFLHEYTDEQKHAIAAQGNKVLCVAGAGTGKTTVLTKRIEFLTAFCGIPRDRVLAITFTRKARQEMQRRLKSGVQVETFNSFCERLLAHHGERFYGKPVRVLTYKDRIRLVHHAVRKCGMDMQTVLRQHFTDRQRNGKSSEQLARLFMNDCFAIIDYYANGNRELEDFSKDSLAAKTVYAVCRSMQQEMRELGLRDYSDQLRDGIALLRNYPELMPRYDHILVDEYQDVNTAQQDLLTLLAPANLFVVGDPRQSIFGWRGSKISYIMGFPADETVVLRKNYRSGKRIVHAANALITRMHLPDLEHHHPEGRTLLHAFKHEQDEIAFITERVLASDTPREEIFVLARTNRQLQDVAQAFAAHGIPHVLRSDEQGLQEPLPGQVVLSTVHAIKGLEASAVFVPFCSAQSYPCMASDHPVLELVKREPLDREMEELRLLYVAITRAKKELHVSYAGTPSMFITNDLRKALGGAYDRTLADGSKELFQRLREWRSAASRKRGLPAYMIFSDKTLTILAEHRPKGLTELHGIPGIGPVKAEQYGEELLDVLRT